MPDRQARRLVTRLAPAASRPLVAAAVAVLLVAAAALAGHVGAAAPAAQAADLDALDRAQLLVEFDGITFDDGIAAGVSPGPGAGQASWAAFSFTVRCGDVTAERLSGDPTGCHPDTTVTWTFGDGTSDTGTSVRHTYPRSGTYRTTAVITTPQDSTTRSVKLLVSDRLADADVAAAGGTRSDRDALWMAHASGLLDSCNPPTGDTRRYLARRICPEPDPEWAVSTGVDPTYSNTNCTDGVTAALHEGTWQLLPGSEPGCLTADELYRAVVVARDGSVPDSRRPIADIGRCEQAEDASVMVRRALELGVPTVPFRDSGVDCTGWRTVSKKEMYDAVAYSTSFDDGCTSTLPDLTVAGQPSCSGAAQLLVRGAPIVGDSVCPDALGGAVCFQPGQPATRAMLAQLLSWLTLRDGQTSRAATITAVPDPATPVALGATVTVTVTVSTAPSAGGTLPTLRWPDVAGWTRACAAAEPLPLSRVTDTADEPTDPTDDQEQPNTESPEEPAGAAQDNPAAADLMTGSTSCSYRADGPGSATATITLSSEAAETHTNVTLQAVDAAPDVAVTSQGTSEGGSAQVTVDATDPDGQAVTVEVGPAGTSANEQSLWAPTFRILTDPTDDRSPAAVAKVVDGGVTVAGDDDFSGDATFAVRVCAGSCTSEDVTVRFDPSNDPPSGYPTHVTLPTAGAVVTFDLPADDARDPDGQVDLYEIGEADDGLLFDVQVDGQWVPATPGMTVSSAAVRVVSAPPGTPTLLWRPIDDQGAAGDWVPSVVVNAHE